VSVAVAVERDGDAGTCGWGRKPVGGRWRGEEGALSVDHHLLLLLVAGIVVVAAAVVVAVLVRCLLLARKLGGHWDASSGLVV